ncbi:MAG: GvpL/GvpF family gas vesicle protein [Bacillota bacterium]
MSDFKKYLYCVISTDEPMVFDMPGMGGAGRVYTVNFNDIAMVVSDSSADRFSLSRENLLTHQKVLEEVMQYFTLLPVKFGTHAESAEDIQEYVLKKRYSEFKETINYFNGKNQMSLKVLWTDMSEVYREIIQTNPTIKKLRDAAMSGRGGSRNDLIEIGRYLEQELAGKKEAERDRTVKALKKYAHRIKLKDNYGDEMFVNANFLIEQSKQEQFDVLLGQIAETYGSRAFFKYVGPIPPYDFIQIFIN